MQNDSVRRPVTCFAGPGVVQRRIVGDIQRLPWGPGGGVAQTAGRGRVGAAGDVIDVKAPGGLIVDEEPPRVVWRNGQHHARKTGVLPE